MSNPEPTDEADQNPQPCDTDQPPVQVTPRPVQLKLEATLNLLKMQGNEKEPLVSGLCFLSDGRIAAVDNHYKTCFILSSDLQMQGLSYKFKRNPFDVICYEENKLAVTFGYVE